MTKSPTALFAVSLLPGEDVFSAGVLLRDIGMLQPHQPLDESQVLRFGQMHGHGEPGLIVVHFNGDDNTLTFAIAHSEAATVEAALAEAAARRYPKPPAATSPARAAAANA